MDKAQAKTLIQKAAKDQMNKRVVKEERLSHGEPGKDSEVKVTKQNVSLVKYLRGITFKNWAGAEDEERIMKSMNERFGTEGGFLVPTEVSSELIELLKSATVVRNMPGVRIVQMSGNRLEMGRVDTGPTITWGGENTAISEDTSLAFGQISLQLKKAVCAYEVSRELIADAQVGAEALIRQELADALALAEDKAFLEGTGGTQPLGLYSHPDINNTDLSGTMSWDEISEAMYQCELYNGTVTGWCMHPRNKHTLRTFKDSNGRYLYENNITRTGAMDTLGGVPVAYSTQMKITLAPGSAESWMVCGQWSNFLIGENEGIRIESTDTGGSAFADDQVWIKAVRRVDCALRHPLTFARIVGIQK